MGEIEHFYQMVTNSNNLKRSFSAIILLANENTRNLDITSSNHKYPPQGRYILAAENIKADKAFQEIMPKLGGI